MRAHVRQIESMSPLTTGRRTPVPSVIFSTSSGYGDPAPPSP
jgi:hypothetical protein